MKRKQPRAPLSLLSQGPIEVEDLALRDTLAAERTALANERTLLSYIRTALGLLAGSVTLIHFVDIGWLRVLGWVLLPTGPMLLGIGLWRFWRVRTILVGRPRKTSKE